MALDLNKLDRFPFHTGIMLFILCRVWLNQWFRRIFLKIVNWCIFSILFFISTWNQPHWTFLWTNYNPLHRKTFHLISLRYIEDNTMKSLQTDSRHGQTDDGQQSIRWTKSIFENDKSIIIIHEHWYISHSSAYMNAYAVTRIYYSCFYVKIWR